jgi:hypothetical protein
MCLCEAHQIHTTNSLILVDISFRGINKHTFSWTRKFVDFHIRVEHTNDEFCISWFDTPESSL